MDRTKPESYMEGIRFPKSIIENKHSRPFVITEKEFTESSPSRQKGMSVKEEMEYRTRQNTLMFDMSQKLSLPQIVVNHSATILHRYYTLKPMVRFNERLHCPCNKRSEYFPVTFHDAVVASGILFISTKFEEKVRKSDHVKKGLVQQYLSSKEKPGSCKECWCGYHANPAEFLDKLTEDFTEMEQEILRVLGFHLEVSHAHVEMMQLLRLTDTRHELGQTAYFLTSTCNQITPFSLFHTSEEIAAICLYTTLKWSGFEIPKSAEGKHWVEYLKTPMTLETLAAKSAELVNYANSMPQSCKAKLFRWRAGCASSRDIPRSLQMPEVNGGPGTQAGSSTGDRGPKRISMTDYMQHRNHGSSHGGRGSQSSQSADSALTPVDRESLRDKDRHAQAPPQGFHRSGTSSRSGSQGQSSKDNGRASSSHGLSHPSQHRPGGSNGQKRREEDSTLGTSAPSQSGSHGHADAAKRPRTEGMMGSATPSGSNGQKRQREEDASRSSSASRSGSHGHGAVHGEPAKRLRTEGMGPAMETSAGVPHSGYRSSSQHSGRHSTHVGNTAGHSSGVPAGYSMSMTNPSKAPQGYQFSRNAKPGLPQGQERPHDPAYSRDSMSRSHHASSSHRPSAQPGHSQSSMRSKPSNRSHPYSSSGSSGRHESQSQRQSTAWPSGDSHMTEGGSPMEVTNTSPRDIELGSFPSSSYHSSSNALPGLPPSHSQSSRR